MSWLRRFWAIAWRLPFVAVIWIFGLLATGLAFLSDAMDEWATMLCNLAFSSTTNDKQDVSE